MGDRQRIEEFDDYEIKILVSKVQILINMQSNFSVTYDSKRRRYILKEEQ